MIKVRHEAFMYYFRFMEERMNIFWGRYHNNPAPWTSDTILKSYKFTNVYRACDRVSQYLIKEVINQADEALSGEDILLNIILFKVFNRIDTWEQIKKRHPAITVNNFNAETLSQLLTHLREYGPIFNTAYIMTGPIHPAGPPPWAVSCGSSGRRSAPGLLPATPGGAGH